MHDLSPVLKTGHSLAIFKEEGTQPSSNDLFTIIKSGCAM